MSIINSNSNNNNNNNNHNHETVLTIKVSLDGDLRRFTLPTSSSDIYSQFDLETLTGVITSLYDLVSPVKLAWLDSDSDLITLSSEEDLKEALSEISTLASKRILRLEATRKADLTIHESILQSKRDSTPGERQVSTISKKEKDSVESEKKKKRHDKDARKAERKAANAAAMEEAKAAEESLRSAHENKCREEREAWAAKRGHLLAPYMLGGKTKEEATDIVNQAWDGEEESRTILHAAKHCHMAAVLSPLLGKTPEEAGSLLTGAMEGDSEEALVAKRELKEAGVEAIAELHRMVNGKGGCKGGGKGCKGGGKGRGIGCKGGGKGAALGPHHHHMMHHMMHHIHRHGKGKGGKGKGGGKGLLSDTTPHEMSKTTLGRGASWAAHSFPQMKRKGLLVEALMDIRPDLDKASSKQLIRATRRGEKGAREELQRILNEVDTSSISSSSGESSSESDSSSSSSEGSDGWCKVDAMEKKKQMLLNFTGENH